MYAGSIETCYYGVAGESDYRANSGSMSYDYANETEAVAK